MKVSLIMTTRQIQTLKDNLGAERIEVQNHFGANFYDGGCYYRVEFEIRHDFDIMRIFHAGEDCGIEIEKLKNKKNGKQNKTI